MKKMKINGKKEWMFGKKKKFYKHIFLFNIIILLKDQRVKLLYEVYDSRAQDLDYKSKNKLII